MTNYQKQVDKEAKWQGLEKCEFNDTCDFCQSPELGSFAKIYYPPEDVAETEYYVCGKCLALNKNAKPNENRKDI